MKKITSLLVGWSVGLLVTNANANWEYGAGYYDDGERFTVTIAGGAAWGMGDIKNEYGSLVPEPYWAMDDGTLVTETWCGGFEACQDAGLTQIGMIDLAGLPAKKDLDTFSWASNVAVGWAIGGGSHWRMAADWLHIGSAKYSATPMFEGELEATSGALLSVASTGVYSHVESDVFSAMFYYDFFTGDVKQPKTFIPYIGFGIGYASSETTTNITDLYGDLSGQDAFWDFGEDTGGATLSFYESKTTTNNFSASVALGFSYGLTDYMFLDASLRATWIPTITWGLNNEYIGDVASTGPKYKDIFSAENVLYTTAMLGLRFEF